MLLKLTELITIFAYLLLTLLQRQILVKPSKKINLFYLSLGIFALSSHAWLLHHWIDTPNGQNLAFFYLVSQITWLSAFILFCASWWKRLAASISLLIFPFAALTILLAIFFPGERILIMAHSPKELIHILLAMLAFSVFIIAAIQSILLAIGERWLRRKEANHFMKMLPPLETMEIFLFRMIAIGFFLLTLVLFSSILFFQNLFVPPLLHKSILTILSWVIFASLLYGRYYLHWRGQVAIRWTLSGVMLLTLLLVLSAVLSVL